MSLSVEFNHSIQDLHLHDLALRAVALWGVDAEAIEPIKIRENAVFRIIIRGGGRAAMRIHRPGYHSNESLRSEFEWTAALRRYGVIVPCPLVSSAGRVFEEVEIPGTAEMRQIDLLEWADGVQLGSVELGISTEVGSVETAYQAIGELAAQMHNHSSGWQRPTAFTRHAWDLTGLCGDRPVWGPFWNLKVLTAPQRILIERVRARLKEDLREFGTGQDRFGLIHADLVPENVLVNGGHFSVIDFDDSGFGWHMFELATTLYFIRHQDYYSRALEAVIAGYRTHRTLPESHLDLLPAFLAARGTTYLGWLHSRCGEQAAQDLAPQLIELAMSAAEGYLSNPI